jgi:hypothetical protein
MCDSILMAHNRPNGIDIKTQGSAAQARLSRLNFP